MERERDAQLTQEAFVAMAAMLGVELQEGDLEALHPEVAGLLERVAAVHEIDASSVPPEHAVSSADGSPA
jgi:hypothetical protein